MKFTQYSLRQDLELDGGDQATSQSQSEEDEDVDMIQAAPTIHGGRPTPHPHPAQPRGFQVRESILFSIS